MAGKPALTAETKYQLLLRISHEIRDTLEVDEILDRLLDTVASVVPYDAGGIFVLSEDLSPTPRLRPRGVIAGVARRGFDALPPEGDDMVNRGLGIIGHVIRTGEAVVAPDVRRDPRYVAGRQGTRAEIAVPIAGRARTFGALNLESDQVGAFDDADLEILCFMADAAASVLQRAVLHRQLVEKRWMEDQLQLAQQVQARLLPREAPRLPGWSLAGLCVPTFEIGGDCFDYIPLPDGRLALLVADVAGKGIPAALIMASFRALVRSHAAFGARPAELARAVNRQLHEHTGSASFVTAVYGVLDPRDARLTYVNCGHNPPLVVRAGGSTESLGCGGPLMGPFPETGYEESSTSLGPGDVLLMYTDGVVESAGGAGEDFGPARLAAAVRDAGTPEAADVIRAVVEATRRFYGTDAYDDDFTVVAIARR